VVHPELAGAPPTEAAPAPSLVARRAGHLGDTVFRGLSTGAAVFVLAVIVAIAVFLAVKAVPAVVHDRTDFLTGRVFSPDDTPVLWGLLPMLVGTLETTLVAVVIGAPVAIGSALFITHYAPRRLASVLGALLDLLAAVPSVVFGLWGLIFLSPRMVGVSRYLSAHLGWFPPFHGNGTYGKSVFVAGTVLAIMILPIVAALSREVFLQVPSLLTEAATALGATRWEVVRTVVLPYGRSGVISAVMLGIGRALGETIAVALILSQSFTVSLHLLQPGGNTIAANIANYFGDAGPTGVDALIASGLVLFVVTVLVNLVARGVVARGLPGVS
jgi:phosphate transport system permease protein